VALKGFTPFDRAALIFRLGILNVWSSLHPDGYYRLDLSKRDEKLILKTLMTLSAAGTRQEFSEVDFRADPQGKVMTDENMATQFKKLWKTERSIPDVGVVRFNFQSDPKWTIVARSVPDSLHSELLSVVYATPLLLPLKDATFSTKRGLEIPHSLKKASIMAANVGVKFNFEMGKRKKQSEEQQEVAED